MHKAFLATIFLALVIISSYSFALELDFNLVNYYKFDNNANWTTTTADAKLRAIGTITGATVNQDGKIHRTFLYDGTNDRVILSSPYGDTKRNFTIATWIKPGYNTLVSPGGNKFPIIERGSASPYNAFRLLDNGAGQPVSVGCAFTPWTEGSGTVSARVTKNYEDTWVFVACTFDFDNHIARIYIDDNLAKQNTDNTTGAARSWRNIATYNSAAGNYADGWIDDLGIWDRALTQSEVLSLWNKGNGWTYPFGITDINLSVKRYGTNTDINNSMDCNSGDVTYTTKMSPYDLNFPMMQMSYNCTFSATGYDSNTVFFITDSNKTINVTLNALSLTPVKLDFNVYAAGTSTHLTGIDYDCNVNAVDLNNQSSPFSSTTDINTAVSCQFLKSGYDTNSFAFNYDVNRTIVMYLTPTPPIPTANLVAWYKLDELSGNVVVDSFRGNNNGTSLNVTLGQTGKIKTDYNFNNAASDVNLGDTNFDFLTAHTNGKFTVSMWSKMTVLNADGLNVLWGKFDTPFESYGTVLDVRAGGIFYLGFYNGNSNFRYYASGATNMLDGSWHNVVVTQSAGYTTAKLYLDNVEISLTPTTVGTPTTVDRAIPAQIGVRNGATYVAKGAFDEVGFFDTNLSLADIGKLYNSGNGVTYCSDGTFAATCPQIKIDFNVYQTGTSTHLTDVNMDCNVNSLDLINQSSPFSSTTDGNTVVSCQFLKTGYDANTQVFNYDVNRTKVVYLTLTPTSVTITFNVRGPGSGLVTSLTDSQMTLAPNLTCRWKFDDAGSTATDTNAICGGLSFSSPQTQQAAVNNTGFNLNSTAGVGFTNPDADTGDKTMMFWGKNLASRDNYNYISIQSDGRTWSLGKNGLAVNKQCGGGTSLLVPENTDSNWHLYAGVYTGGYFNFYIDGNYWGQIADNGAGCGTSVCALFGAGYMDSSCSTSTNATTGTVDDARIYTSALSAASILAEYNNSLATYTELTDVNMDCNVNALDLTNQNSPFTSSTTVNTAASCQFLKTGYDTNTQAFNYDANKNIIVMLYQQTNPCIRTINQDWNISTQIDCNFTAVNLGTGKLIISPGGRLRLYDSNVIANQLKLNTVGDLIYIFARSFLRIA